MFDRDEFDGDLSRAREQADFIADCWLLEVSTYINICQLSEEHILF
jgi:hypothetical protein